MNWLKAIKEIKHHA